MADNASNTTISKFHSEWNTNARLPWAVYLLLGIVWLYAILVLRDAVSSEYSKWDAMEAKNARARSTAAEADWPTRAQEIKVALNDLEALLWRDGSVGLSQAAFEERVSQSLAAAGVVVRSLRTTVGTESAATPAQVSLVQLRSRVQVDFRPASMYNWLASLSRARVEKTPSMFVETLNIRPASFGQLATAEIEVVGFAVKATTDNAGGSK